MSLSTKLNDLRDRINDFRIVDNWHKHPWISKALCSIGRHDYEYHETIYDDQGDSVGAELECFYCLQKKGSRRF